MAQSKPRSQPSQRRGGDTSRVRNERQPEQKRSGDRPREEPDRRNIESPSPRDEGHNPAVNPPMDDEPSRSRRPGGSGDIAH